MLLAPPHGFVFLAMTKTGSTAIERAFGPSAHIAARKPPSIKHTRYRGFQRHIAPFLAANGFPRETYEVVCVFREPIDWLFSWYRYRSREALLDPSAAGHRNYTGNLSFEEFVRAYMGGEAQFARVGRQANFVAQADSSEPGVDRIFRYEHLDLLVEYLCDKTGTRPALETPNVSPGEPRDLKLSKAVEAEIREYLAPEYRLYEKAAS